MEEVGARPSDFVAETSTMIGLVLGVFGIGFLCWALFTLAVYALPCFAGVTAGLAAFHSGAGVIGAIIVGVIAGVLTLGAGQAAFAVARSPFIRAAIALLFAAPAAVAGYHATLGLAQIGVPSAGWREAFAIIGAILAAGTAWGRMTLLADPLPTSWPSPPAPAQPLLTGLTKEAQAVPPRRLQVGGRLGSSGACVTVNGSAVEARFVLGAISSIVT